MKMVSWKKHLIVSAAIATVSVSISSAALISGFDDASEVDPWRFDFGGSGTESWNSSEDADGNAASGALQLVFDFPANGVAFTSDQFGTGQDWTSYTHIAFDIKVDPASATDAFGNNGCAQFVLRNTDNYDWVEQWGGNVNDADGWVHIETPLLGSHEAVRAFTLQLYGGSGQNLAGPVTLYLDNIETIPEPSTLGMTGLAAAGILLIRRFRK